MTAALPAPPPIATGTALLLDFDGTLVELADRHDAIVVDDGLRALLPRLTDALAGRVAIVSGRPADEIVAYLHLDPAAPGIGIAGSHGLEHVWPDGRRDVPDPPLALDRAIAALEAAVAAHPGTVIERKPFGAALHYRQAPDAATACDAIAERIAAETGLQLQRGKMVCELKLGGKDKGDAVRGFLAHPPFAGTRPLFVGDDLTDEAGFRAATAAGGAGVLVGGREGTAARWSLADVGAVRAWLGAAAR